MAAFARWADAESRDCDEPIYFVSAAKPTLPAVPTALNATLSTNLVLRTCAGRVWPRQRRSDVPPLDSPLRRSQKRYIVPENMWENYGDCMRANGAGNARL
jgi:hypothetical protein